MSWNLEDIVRPIAPELSTRSNEESRSNASSAERSFLNDWSTNALADFFHELALAFNVGYHDLPVREPLRVEDVKLHAPRRAGHVRDARDDLVDRLGLAVTVS